MEYMFWHKVSKNVLEHVIFFYYNMYSLLFRGVLFHYQNIPRLCLCVIDVLFPKIPSGMGMEGHSQEHHVGIQQMVYQHKI